MPSVLHKDRTMAFVHIPKTGGISISFALLETGEYDKYEDWCRPPIEDMYTIHHAPASELIQHTRNVVTVVRHPVDRFVSAFITAAALNLHSFSPTVEGMEEFCARGKEAAFQCVFFRPMIHFTHDAEGNALCRIYRFEEWDNTCMSILGHTVSDVKNKNVIPSFTPGPIAMESIREWYADDFQQFGYS